MMIYSAELAHKMERKQGTSMMPANAADLLGAGPALLREHHDHEHELVANFIRARFAVSYGASLTHLMPRLFTVSGRMCIPQRQPHQEEGRDRGEIDLIGAFGLREAACATLFMEQYLDRPVDQVIAAHVGRPVARKHIMEVGNLVADPGGARRVIASLTHYLYHGGYEWVVFTGVASLRAAFARLGLSPFLLAPANPDRLDESERLSWGRYFAARPQVMGGDVRAGYRILCCGDSAEQCA